MPQHALDVVFADGEVNAAAIAVFNKPQRGVGGVLDRARLATHPRDLVEPLACERRIPVASGDHDIPSISSTATLEKNLQRRQQYFSARLSIAKASQHVVACPFLCPCRHERRRNT